ncbi:unnamed protein product (macronuclear) [Paramecium tetraurelia]|uniref:RING-type E3 ubiquitin transferase n=1 Tax=Paramecium tetraurelia TaxID=5888 RepID=A0CVB2_PARTE|nr:uncharacterized protein GSPATT00010897001 [Paramecium tetraurelia]CAK74729.1 unnamed protein product [Paramecium tetraurelia]|eukprot:XP_001442126.1 hypothetical protein (macronuclear) [Paramecium tetraurelia strain d4-2]
MENIQRLLIAPNSSRKYLIKQDGNNLLFSIILCLFYIDNLMNEKLPYSAAWFKCSYLFLLFISNLCAIFLYVLFIPQLITLKQEHNKKDQIIQLRTLLQYKLHQYLNINQYLINVLYFAGILLVICDFFGEALEETQNIKKILRYSVFGYLLNRIFITGRLENALEEQTIVEFKESFIKIEELNEISLSTLEICSICYEEFRAKDFVAEYQCQGKHTFHQDCVLKWLKMPMNKTKVCPYCKQLPDSINKYF